MCFIQARAWAERLQQGGLTLDVIKERVSAHLNELPQVEG